VAALRYRFPISKYSKEWNPFYCRYRTKGAYPLECQKVTALSAGRAAVSSLGGPDGVAATRAISALTGTLK
jgi:hypothetical protein